MAIFKCKMCGGALEIQDGSSVAVCSFCETKQTIPKLDNDTRVNLYDRANHFRRNNDYDKAMFIYEQLLAADKTDAEAYWSILLCKYGVEYVEDPKTHKMLPTINRAQYTSIFADEDYKSAIQYADGYQRDVYEAEAKELDKIQKGILAISQKEEPFDIFICYKETDTYGRRTQDSVLAQELYFQLKQEGFKVFFSRITLEDKLGVAYEPYIFAALNTAKAMVVIGTSKDNLNAVWVKNEWSRYLALIKKDSSKVLIPAYRDMDPYDLPEEFSHLQAQDMSKLGFMQDLVRGIKKIVGATKPQPTTVVVESTPQTAAVTIEPLLKRAFIFLEDADWEMANNYAERVLDLNPECSQAYVVKLLAELHIKNPQTLSKLSRDLNVHSNYKKAVRFASEEEKEILLNYNKDVLNNIALAAKERTYVGALNRISTAATITDKLLKQSISELRSISGYKDADQQVAKLEQRLEAYFQKKREAEEKARIKAEEEKARKQRIAEENRIRAARRAKKVKIAALCMFGLIVLAILISTVFVPVGEINHAKTLVNGGGFEKALVIFGKWGNLYDLDKEIEIAHTLAYMYQQKDDKYYNEEIREMLGADIDVKIGYRKDYTFEDATNTVQSELVDDVMWFTYEKPSDFYNPYYSNPTGGLFTPIKDGYKFNKWKLVEHHVKNNEEVHLIFEADWTPIQFNIQYNLDGGINVSGNRNKYTIETQTFALLNPYKHGYDFVGWSSSTNSTPTIGLLVEQGTTGDLNFTAHWEPAHYTITLDLNGGTLNASTTVDVVYNSTYKLPTPSKRGYQFIGWYFGNIQYPNGKWTTTTDVKVTAKWQAINYSLSYNLEGGKLAQSNRGTYTVEDSFTLNNPTKSGYVFVGWTWDGQSTPIKTVNIKPGTVGNIEFTANWISDTFSITYDVNGGSLGGTATKSVVYNTNYQLSVPQREGYTFAGWHFGSTKLTDETGASISVYSYEQSITVTAHWTPITYSLTYNLDGGTISSITIQSSYTIEKSISLGQPSKTGYTFIGWTWEGQTDPVLNVYFAGGTTMGDKHFVANWQANTYNITYAPNGGSVSQTTQIVVYDAEYTLETPIRDGYDFLEWKSFIFSESLAQSGVWKKTSDYTLVAQWSVVTYNITYDLDGGIAPLLNTNPTTYTIEKSIKLYNPSKAGHTFLGWTYDGQTTPVKDLTIPAGRIGNVKFTAHWQANTYTITYDTNGGEVYPATQNVVYGTEYTLATPTRIGYDFAGWEYNNAIQSDGVWSMTSNPTFVAEWVPISYGLTYKWNGGSMSAYPVAYTIEESIKLNNPTRTGYTFIGWTCEGQPTPVKNLTIPAGRIGDIEFTATWQANTYTITYDANGGKVSPATQEVVYDEEYSLAIPTRTGYDFAGWLYNDTIQIDGIWSIASNPTLVAQWTVKAEMQNYEFTSTATTCEITAVKDKTITNAIIPAYVTSIGNNAFSNCSNMIDINIPDNVISIGKQAFYNCDGLSSIKFSDNSQLTTIGNEAFGDCDGLNEILFYENCKLTSIGDYAFRDCINLTTVAISKKVETIGTAIFTGCGSLEELTIPFVGNRAGVTSGSQPQYTFGYLFGTMSYAGGSSTLQSQYSPASATGSVSVEYWVPSSLKTVIVLGGYVPYGAFGQCKNIINIMLSNDVTGIGSDAFVGCDGLTSIVIPDSVTTIGSSAFYDCDSLTSVTFGKNSQLTTIGFEAFYSCDSLTSITIPDNVTTIGSYAFYNCDSLTGVTTGNSVTTIGERAFYNCNSLTSVTIGGRVTTIGSYAFYNCTSLTNIVIPDSVTTIGSYAFSGCSSLESITIPFIGAQAICGNSQYPFGYIFGTDSYEGGVATEQHYYYRNGDGTTSTYTATYYIPSSLKSVTVTGGNIPQHAFYRCKISNVTLEGDVGQMGYEAFAYSDLGSVTINAGNMSSNYVFRGCELTSLTIGGSVTTIGDYAFYECTRLTSVIIGNSVTAIGYNAFFGCMNLADIYYTGTEEQWNAISVDAGNTYLTNATIHYNYVPTEE